VGEIKNLSQSSMSQRVIIIGSGFGGLGTACLLAKAGYQVTVLEKNDQLGGRAGLLEADGFRFDMGPSWYLMPDIFENFFKLLGERVEDHLNLVRLEPSYRIFFKDTPLEPIDIYGDLAKDLPTLEKLEPGITPKLHDYLQRAEFQYRIAVDRFIYKNYDSIFDFFTWEVIKSGTQLSVFQNMDSYVKKFFKRQEVQKILQYPLVFLGSSPYQTPALYSLMSHLDFHQGVFYPMGGIYEVIKALAKLAHTFGAELKTQAEVVKILHSDHQVSGVQLTDGTQLEADIIISNADIEHTQNVLLADEPHLKRVDWSKKQLAPSAFILYLGLNKLIPAAKHHSLIFSQDWQKNFGDIFTNPQWPSDPSLYICAPSKTDPSVAPAGCENLFVLVPIAPGLDESDECQMQEFEEQILKTLAEQLHEPDLKNHIMFKQRFTGADFSTRYHSYKGTALGLSHSLWQTAIFRPNNVDATMENLYYVGANTNPGIGMPMCLISAELVYKRLIGDRSSRHLTQLTKHGQTK
jgi:phytoene desaturase